MEKYIGVKMISAEPAVEGGFPKAGVYGGITARDGYKVIYEDGYESWSPTDVFEKAYRPTSGMTFGLAIEAMKKGLKVSRTGWNGSGIFAVLSPGKKGLPASDFFNPHLSKHALAIGGVMDVRPEFMLKTAQEDVAYWAPSGSDCLGEDWYIVD